MSALSGIDIALWDMKARKLGVPIYDLLGGKVRNSIKVYSWIGGDRPNEVKEQALVNSPPGIFPNVWLCLPFLQTVSSESRKALLPSR